jgi:hypothetical protein
MAYDGEVTYYDSVTKTFQAMREIGPYIPKRCSNPGRVSKTSKAEYEIT